MYTILKGFTEVSDTGTGTYCNVVHLVCFEAQLILRNRSKISNKGPCSHFLRCCMKFFMHTDSNIHQTYFKREQTEMKQNEKNGGRSARI